MGSWNTIAESDVLAEFVSPAEQASLIAVANAVDGVGPILTANVNTLRGIISAAGYPIDTLITIPDSLREDLIAVVRWRWLIAFPQLESLQTKERKAAFDLAMEHFDQVTSQERGVETPPGFDDTSGAVKGGNFGTEQQLVMRTHVATVRE